MGFQQFPVNNMDIYIKDFKSLYHEVPLHWLSVVLPTGTCPIQSIDNPALLQYTQEH